jgi:long-chain acyl-CoA synthetase
VEPAEVEAVLRSHPGVHEAIVYARKRGTSRQSIAAIVESRSVSEVELLRYCTQKLDGYKCPRQIEIRPSLPRNAQGKLARKLIEDGIAREQHEA